MDTEVDTETDTETCNESAPIDDSYLRYQALDLAVRVHNINDPEGADVKRAEEFLRFLKGSESTGNTGSQNT